MEPPSSQLMQSLRELRLCTAADLRRCRRIVRRLACDLPSFDSVWIDALQQLGRLTPFQARRLQSDASEHLKIGPCVLMDRIGGGRFSETFLARVRAGSERCVLKRVAIPPEWQDERRTAVELAIARLSGWKHPGVVGPKQCLVHESHLILISEPVRGPHLGELLVRRGRMPAGVVEAIATQLIDALAALESRRVVHGDVSLRNVRIAPSGRVVLVEAGVQPALFPQLTIHAGLAPDRYEGIAPELIGTGRPADAASDVYALGCLLWQLLAGRPPHATADPLGKLAAHQSKPIADVRTWAPDVPARLAEAIASLTRKNPERRLNSFVTLRELWGASSPRHRRQVARFVSQFSAPAPLFNPSTGGRRAGFWPSMAAFLLLISGTAAALTHHSAQTTLLALRGHAADWFHTAWNDRHAGDPSDGTSDVARLPFPAPDARGTITLRGPGPYEAAEIAAASALIIRGEAQNPAEIVVSNRPLSLNADRVILENVIIRRNDASQSTEPLVAVQSNHLLLRTCRLIDSGQSNETAAAIVSWRSLDRNSRRTTQIQVRDTVLQGARPAVLVQSVPKSVVVRNALADGCSAFLAADASESKGQRWELDLARLTMRGARAFLHLRDAGSLPPSVTMEATDCVFDLAGEQASLVGISVNVLPKNRTATLSLQGEGSLISPQAGIARWMAADSQSAAEATGDQIEVEGLTAGRFEFVGPERTATANSALRTWQAPRRSPTPPGIDVARMLPDRPLRTADRSTDSVR